MHNGEGVLGKMGESGGKGVDDDRIRSFHLAKSRFLEILTCFWCCFGGVSVTIVGRMHLFWIVVEE